MERNHLPWIGFVLGLLFWLVDAALDTSRAPPAQEFHQVLLAPDGNALVQRLLALVLLLSLGMLARATLQRSAAATALRQRDVRRLDELWERAIECLADPIYLVDLDDTLLRANRAFFDTRGLTPDQALGRNIMDIMHPEGEPVPCPVCRARQERRDAIITVEQTHPDNTVGHAFEVMVRIIRDENDQPLGIIMGMRDLNRQREIEAELRQHRDHLEELVTRRTQQLENSNRELEAFSYSVSHDLRAPLRCIDGFARILEEEYMPHLDARGQDCLRRLLTNSQRMDELIDDLLQFSRMARGELRHAHTDLVPMAKVIMDELREQAPNRQVDFQHPDRLLVYGDTQLLRVALENVLHNAWKYTGKRDTALIELGSQTQGNRQVHYVRDNGAGFDMRYVDQLFGAFQRLHNKQEFPGTGIGLATVQRIVHRHGGEVWAQAQVDRGATLYFHLPEKPAVALRVQ